MTIRQRAIDIAKAGGKIDPGKQNRYRLIRIDITIKLGD